jgi:hypothetical protein
MFSNRGRIMAQFGAAIQIPPSAWMISAGTHGLGVRRPAKGLTRRRACC